MINVDILSVDRLYFNEFHFSLMKRQLTNARLYKRGIRCDKVKSSCLGTALRFLAPFVCWLLICRLRDRLF